MYCSTLYILSIHLSVTLPPPSLHQMVWLLSAASCSLSSVMRILSSGCPARTSRRPRTLWRWPPRPRRSMKTSSSLRDPKRSGTPVTPPPPPFFFLQDQFHMEQKEIINLITCSGPYVMGTNVSLISAHFHMKWKSQKLVLSLVGNNLLLKR